jgi:hypothetical protein
MTVAEFNQREVRPNDRWLFKEPLTLEQLAEYRKNLAVHTQEHRDMPVVGQLTCDGCGLAPICSLVFDDYNTEGDCLYDK